MHLQDCGDRAEQAREEDAQELQDVPGDGQEGCQGRKPLHEVQRAPQCLSCAQRPQAHLYGVHVPLLLPSAPA